MTMIRTRSDTPAEVGDYATPEARWQAVLDRDVAADGHFVSAVRTTGIYCRPSCPARRPKRENMSFLDSPETARAHGFRACLRCLPDLGPAERLAPQAVTAAARMIEAAIDAEVPTPPLQALADRAGFSAFHFHRLFKRVLGVTPRAYAAALRSGRAAERLGAGDTVTEALYAAGFSSSSRFYAEGAARLGMTPRARRDGGRGETIRHATANTTLGPVLVAATAKGVCAIQFGESASQLTEWLAARFPQADLAGVDADLAATLREVVALVEQPGAGHALPLDLRGTAFQERVWQALRAIPPGTTASYTQVAAAIGVPRAVRGVASACAANPVAVAVPCHRVVRSDGDLAGYRWGLPRKAELLKREAGS